MLNIHAVNAVFGIASTVLALADKPAFAAAFFFAAIAGVTANAVQIVCRVDRR
jgi:hypothetical protein